MLSAEQITTLREQVANVIANQLIKTHVDWVSVQQLANPTLCIEAQFQDRLSGEERVQPLVNPGLRVSGIIDLTGLISSSSNAPKDTCASISVTAAQDVAPIRYHTTSLSQGDYQLVSQSCVDEGRFNKSARKHTDVSGDGDENTNRYESGERKAISGLRPSRTEGPIIEDNTQRQMQIMTENFPKRRKAEVIGYAMKPSTLDKLIVGIWEQIHGGLSIDPQEILGQFATARFLESKSSNTEAVSASPDRFNDTTIFCRKVTQASRACRSIEVIVQARWVEHFDSYVEQLKSDNPKISDTKHRKSALVEACGELEWPEKELRNKMAVWRGYKEIKDAGGWAALVFAGMGIYRFCKYRIGFDKESMQRLHNLRPALEIAADTLHPHWRQLLCLVGEPSQRIYHGHHHDWVVHLDGSQPTPLYKTYLQWDPHFTYKQIDESVIDQAAWGGDDPRWTPSSPPGVLTRISISSICEVCDKEQSDDPKLNCCYCFPTLFGCAAVTPFPVQVFRTPDGRNNGLMALCAFERGAAVGEFIGVVTKGLQDVDVMENTIGSNRYQIWQGKQGNFTRFANHSCNANAQYQRFTWVDTQRIILVSKGIEAGSEITVDYSDKYWEGLDKKCLCGEKSCRYKRN
ncbi:hypothetical protein F5Y16DRAFT_364086 [Xylariaceae sp. FL0255]|nr:hypothetical protein F5Y16DRAFT_364086 [Xylariaceae sp. FL0255]